MRVRKRDERRNGIPSDVVLLRNLVTARGAAGGEMTTSLETTPRLLRRGGLTITEVIGKEIGERSSAVVGSSIDNEP